MYQKVYLLKYASDMAGAEKGSADGPKTIQLSPYFAQLKQGGVQFFWGGMDSTAFSQPNQSKLSVISLQCDNLANQISKLIEQKHFFIVLGGDHSSAIGTWSGAAFAKRGSGPLGLIWVDAHLDSHTPQTSHSGNIHGMPLACLLGYGAPELTKIADNLPKLQPENVCVIGVRSYEDEELALLKKLNVRIFFMEEVIQKGLKTIFNEAIKMVSKNTASFGISIDVDSIDPKEAPGTGVAVDNGLRGKDLCESLSDLSLNPKFIGAEIVEFDPHRDKNQITEKLIINLISALSIGSKNE